MNSRLLSYVKTIFMFLFFMAAMILLSRELSHVDFKETISLFRAMPTMNFLLLIAAGLLTVLTLSLYDYVLTRNLNVAIPLRRLLPISFITNAMNNILGFGGLFGAGLRLFQYQSRTPEYEPMKRGISLLLLSTLSGLSVLCYLAYSFINITAIPYGNWIVLFACIYAPLFLISSVIRPIKKGARFLGISFTLVSIIDWLAVILLFYFILTELNIHIPLTALAGLFIIASLSGVISMVPGGLGAFDVVMLAGLQSFGVSQEKSVLVLLLYRTIYYFFPMLVALFLAAFEYRETAKSYIEDNKILSSAAMTGSFIRSLQKASSYQFSGLIAALLTIITSLVYYFNHFLIVYDAIAENRHTYYSVVIIFHVAASLMLLVNANGVMHGTKRATMLSILSTIILLVTTFLSYGTIISYIWLSTILALLVYKYQRTTSVKRSLTPLKLGVSLALIFALLFINHWVTIDMLEIYPHTATQFDETLIGRLTWLTLLLFLIISGAITYYYGRKYNELLYQDVSEDEIKHIISTYGGSYVSHLAFTGDKQFFVNEERDAFVMFHKTKNACIIMGDPVGNAEHFEALLMDFYDKAFFIGCDVIFYQVQSKYLSLYHQFGNHFFKIGEEALIPLQDFTISGKKQRAFRATMNKLDKEGYTFSIEEPPFSDDFIAELKTVSDQWLNGKHEMHFSVGAFQRHYLERAPIAVLRDHTGVVAFSTLMPTNYNSTLSVDLIRWLPELDIPAMDALYLNMLLYSQEQGYHYFNMGMATLSNVGQNRYGYARERIAGHVFTHFNNLYSFQGLRKYKQKYNPEWNERYVVYRTYTSLVWNLVRIGKTINQK
ncbi:bifunctional lysylphosphatidylglycerol flippase/synthetase MprF [Macrococcus carouselicus]|uniref:Phosphatidylglycerol lysyltransferase n=1 Tax=Macrococcus carouselicus TaxID=69969 RepID=A0A9Q8FQG8_9STAP|nr:bifunctional lysylphosphatidylglycerol flippase/synthetase MprF [Macrococcus carouselicus]TDM03922.1 bifunctional lysylphosphatidylglycerol flippase/synthetase MprF [Macrococcus carouselicus]